jgi:hypothetical protein
MRALICSAWLVVSILLLIPHPAKAQGKTQHDDARTFRFYPSTKKSFSAHWLIQTRCVRKDFGLRVSGKINRPPRDLTANRFAICVSIVPFTKPKNQ